LLKLCTPAVIIQAAIFSERELTSVRLSSVCCLSVTFVRPTQAIEIFGNVSTPFGTLATVDFQVKFYGDRPRGTPPSGRLNARGVAKYSDFGPVEIYISETAYSIHHHHQQQQQQQQQQQLFSFVPDMTYNVFGGTLNLAQSIYRKLTRQTFNFIIIIIIIK